MSYFKEKTKNIMGFGGGSCGIPSSNVKGKSHLLSLKKPLKYGESSLKSNLDYFMQRGSCVESWVKFNP